MESDQWFDAFARLLRQNFDPAMADRMLQEIRFAIRYKNDFQHGTDGHIRLMTIAYLAAFLDDLTDQPGLSTPHDHP